MTTELSEMTEDEQMALKIAVVLAARTVSERKGGSFTTSEVRDAMADAGYPIPPSLVSEVLKDMDDVFRRPLN